MNSVSARRKRAILYLFVSALSSAVIITFIVSNWSLLTSSNLGVIALMTMIIFAFIFLVITLLVISFYEMTIDPEKKLDRFKQKMANAGHPRSSYVTVYGEGLRHALPGDSQFRYTHMGTTHIFKPSSRVPPKLPASIRFTPVHHKLTDSILVYDNLKDSWLIFY